jgi:nucleoside-specific outer membrane channel protein Tsx
MISQTQTTSFKAQLYQGIHDLDTDVIKIALYTAFANLDADTLIYSATNEVVASGYTAGGAVMTSITVNTSGTTAYVGFTNVSWTSALTARGALIYNSSKGNKSVAVLDFGSDKTSTTTFTITMPANTSTTALIRSSY